MTDKKHNGKMVRVKLENEEYNRFKVSVLYEDQFGFNVINFKRNALGGDSNVMVLGGESAISNVLRNKKEEIFVISRDKLNKAATLQFNGDICAGDEKKGKCTCNTFPIQGNYLRIPPYTFPDYYKFALYKVFALPELRKGQSIDESHWAGQEKVNIEITKLKIKDVNISRDNSIVGMEGIPHKMRYNIEFIYGFDEFYNFYSSAPSSLHKAQCKNGTVTVFSIVEIANNNRTKLISGPTLKSSCTTLPGTRMETDIKLLVKIDNRPIDVKPYWPPH